MLAKDAPEGLRVVVSPLLEIAPVPGADRPDRYSGVIFTSAQAVPFAGPPTHAPVYCVGAETRRQAEGAGWRVQLHAQDADHLYAALVEQKIPTPLLHMAGAHTRGALAHRLTAAGLMTDETTLYTQNALTLSSEARDILAGDTPVIVPLFSPRTAEIFARQHKGTAPLYLVAISQAALAPVAHLDATEAIVARHPSALAIKDEIAHALRRVEARGSPL